MYDKHDMIEGIQDEHKVYFCPHCSLEFDSNLGTPALHGRKLWLKDDPAPNIFPV